MPYRIELVTSEGVVVGFFEVALTISMSALAYWVKEAVRLRREPSVTHWQVRRPDNRILCQVKVQDA